jgi:hypothetical protein
VTFVTVLSISACAPKVRQDYDPDLDLTVTRMNKNKVAKFEAFTLYLNGVKLEEVTGTRYVVWLEAHGPDFLRVQQVTLEIDGELLELGSGKRTEGEVVCWTKARIAQSLGITPHERCDFRETYSYAISEEQLQQLANAENVVLWLRGYEVFLRQEMSSGNLNRFRDFVSNYVIEVQSSAPTDEAIANPTGG